MHLPLVSSSLSGFARKLANRTSRLLTPLFLASGLLASSALQAQTFGNVAMGGGGFVSGIITSKTQANLLYARTDVGGAYRWDAASSRWIPLIDWASTAETGYLGVESIALDPHNSNAVYLLVGTSYFNGGRTAILRSTNQGATFSVTDVTAQFKAHGNGMGRNSGEKLAVDPNNGTILLTGTRANGLFRSTNSGASWSRLNGLNVTTTPNGNGISLVVFDPASGTSGSTTQTIIVGVSQTGTNLFRSNDGGATFSPITSSPTALMPQRAALTPDRNLIITYANGAGPFGTTAEPVNTGAIWKYNIQSGAWTNLTPAANTLPFSGISVDPKNANRLVASTVNTFRTQGAAFGDQFFISTNGGASWTNVVARGYALDANGVTWMTPSQSIHWASSIEFDPFNTSRVFVNSGNGIFTTENIDAVPTVWKFNVRGIEESVPLDLVSVAGAPLFSVIGDFDGFVNTDVTRYGPQHTPRMGTTSGLAVAALNPNRVVRAGNAFYFSNNMGGSWTQGTINGSQGHLALSADGATILHAPSGSSTVFRSTNNGSSWSAAAGLNVADTHPAADQVNSSKFYAYAPSSGAFFVSTNGGVSFSQSATLPTAGSRHLRTVPGNEGHLWVALYGGGLRRSTNSGQTFTSISNVTTCDAVGLGKAAPGTTYPAVYIWGVVGGVQGLFRSTNQGTSWTRVNDDAHEWGGPGNGQFVVGDANVFGRVYMSTVGRGAVYIDSASGSTSVPVTGVSVTPATASISAGATTQLTATVAPANATNPAVSWSTSNASVATVSSSGVVTGIAVGSATITATTQDGGRTATSAVTVTTGNGGVIVSGATYVLTARHSGKVIGINGGATADGALAVQQTSTGAASQRFVVTEVQPGFFRIAPVSSPTRSLDVNGASTADGASIIQWTASSGLNQQWQLISSGGGFFQIRSRSSGKNMDVTGASTSDGAAVIQWTPGTGTNQQFSFTRQ